MVKGLHIGWALTLVVLTGYTGLGCKKKSECEVTVDLVRKCRLHAGVRDEGTRDEQVAMCEEASKTWAEVQDEIDCAVASAGDCARYRSCERGVQRQRLIDEAMRRHSRGEFKSEPGWCFIFEEHRDSHPELLELCPRRMPVGPATDEGDVREPLKGGRPEGI